MSTLPNLGKGLVRGVWVAQFRLRFPFGKNQNRGPTLGKKGPARAAHPDHTCFAGGNQYGFVAAQLMWIPRMCQCRREGENQRKTRISENEAGKCTGLAPVQAAAPRPMPTQRIQENAFNIHAVDLQIRKNWNWRWNLPENCCFSRTCRCSTVGCNEEVGSKRTRWVKMKWELGAGS